MPIVSIDRSSTEIMKGYLVGEVSRQPLRGALLVIGKLMVCGVIFSCLFGCATINAADDLDQKAVNIANATQTSAVMKGSAIGANLLGQFFFMVGGGYSTTMTKTPETDGLKGFGTAIIFAGVLAGVSTLLIDQGISDMQADYNFAILRSLEDDTATKQKIR